MALAHAQRPCKHRSLTLCSEEAGFAPPDLDAPAGAPLACPECVAALAGLDWRRAAGVARLFIEIEGVYPHEAAPSAPLLEALRRASGVAWDYFYARA
ncbi:MAG: hypothetical protein GWO16_06610 [Gammaproteobacteria bacterium]|nr:hypothetical protein [Gammaproteobacteria bacterium]NIR97325.1 hypothetical protein [Gammaproteobacteria bacterium]NIT63368.1 hypothetical protein [Gammaproteobacteria bacterium]NIV20295.1 hypothetical protein [Gammaproteobacteria bacterium]NIX10712.1 hypothetical protein [Gammaproteobacteria bacterium]